MLAEETFDRNPRSATTLLSRCERLEIRHQPHLRGIVCGGHSCEPLIKLVEQLGDGRHSLERNISQGVRHTRNRCAPWDRNRQPPLD